MNFLEQAAAEWFTHQGYFVRTNIKANRRKSGGWNNEIDILAYHPERKELLHVEPSWDSFSWNKKKDRFLKKKFVFSDDEYRKLAKNLHVKKIRRLVITGLQHTTRADRKWENNVEVILISEFFRTITERLKEKSPLKEAVSEGFPILRAIQLTMHYKK